MNSNLLLQLIAARATGGGNPLMAQMLTRMRSTNGGVSAQDPKELLAQLGNNNPLVSMLSKHLDETEATRSVHQSATRPTGVVIDAEPEATTPKETHSNGDGPLIKAGEDVAELKEQIQNLQAETKKLRDRCDLLASTVGACCLCWGQDPACRACRGRGKPGYAIPDETLFGEFVLPAMRVLQAQKMRVSRPAPTERAQENAESSQKIS